MRGMGMRGKKRMGRWGRRACSGCVCLLGAWGWRGKYGGGLIRGAIGWVGGGGRGLCGGLGEVLGMEV